MSGSRTGVCLKKIGVERKGFKEGDSESVMQDPEKQQEVRLARRRERYRARRRAGTAYCSNLSGNIYHIT